MRIASFFEEKLQDLPCNEDTKNYIISIYSNFREENNLSNVSITLLFTEARKQHNFVGYQRIADWLLFSSTLYPQHLRGASFAYYDTVAQVSYESCYKLINGQWDLFRDLSNNYPNIRSEITQLLLK